MWSIFPWNGKRAKKSGVRIFHVSVSIKVWIPVTSFKYWKAVEKCHSKQCVLKVGRKFYPTHCEHTRTHTHISSTIWLCVSHFLFYLSILTLHETFIGALVAFWTTFGLLSIIHTRNCVGFSYWFVLQHTQFMHINTRPHDAFSVLLFAWNETRAQNPRVIKKNRQNPRQLHIYTIGFNAMRFSVDLLLKLAISAKSWKQYLCAVFYCQIFTAINLMLLWWCNMVLIHAPIYWQITEKTKRVKREKKNIPPKSPTGKSQ